MSDNTICVILQHRLINVKFVPICVFMVQLDSGQTNLTKCDFDPFLTFDL